MKTTAIMIACLVLAGCNANRGVQRVGTAETAAGNDVAAVKTEIKADEVAAVAAKVTAAVDASLARIESSIGDVNAHLCDLSATVGDVNANVGGMQATVGDVKTTVGSVDGKLQLGGSGDSVTAWLYAAIAGAAVLYPLIIRPLRLRMAKQQAK